MGFFAPLQQQKLDEEHNFNYKACMQNTFLENKHITNFWHNLWVGKINEQYKPWDPVEETLSLIVPKQKTKK